MSRTIRDRDWELHRPYDDLVGCADRREVDRREQTT
jgi:hypothetical protein